MALLTSPGPVPMSQEAIAELAPNGVLRAAINMANSLLVSGSGPAGEPAGVAPDLAREIATRLGARVAFTCRSHGRASSRMPRARPCGTSA
jgi:ABC-type amino acid transport substrate-binding protein